VPAVHRLNLLASPSTADLGLDKAHLLACDNTLKAHLVGEAE
jgi:hypothetical protein